MYMIIFIIIKLTNEVTRKIFANKLPSCCKNKEMFIYLFRRSLPLFLR